MGKARVSTMLRMVRDYRLSMAERIMFDFLVVKQEDFGLTKPFRHSITQIQEAIGVSRHQQDNTIKLFSQMGFLTITTEYYQNNPYRAFYVNFTTLSMPRVLSAIIKPDTETYRDFSEWIGELAKEQQKKEKTLSKTKRRQMEREETKAKEEAELLYKSLCDIWKRRIDKYNKGELTNEKPKRGKSYTALAIGRNTVEILSKLLGIYDNSTIGFSFTAYADEVLIGEIKPKNVLLYFLTCEDGEYVVCNKYLNYFTENYGYDNT